MAIDGCTYSFEELASSVLPRHMVRLTEALRKRWDTAAFCRPGVGPIAIARNLGLRGEFAGAYVFCDQGTPFYVGISRKVISRIRQHVFTESHFTASLAYLMACESCVAAGRRGERMEDPAFLAEFRKQQLYLRNQQVAAVPIDNPLELYVFEAYAALALQTSKWNTFRTH